PREELVTIEPARLAALAGSNVTVAPLRIALASARLIMYPGMLMAAPGEKAPLNGALVSTSPMTPATAPPASMLRILSLNGQSPRSTSAMRPVSEPGANGTQPNALPEL